MAGIDMDHMLGILATGLETLREQPEAIGTAFKTIIARMRQVTTSGFQEGMLDAEGEVLSLNNVEKALTSIGISLREQSGEFKDLQEVIDAMGRRWEDLNSIQKAYLATTIAGLIIMAQGKLL